MVSNSRDIFFIDIKSISSTFARIVNEGINTFLRHCMRKGSIMAASDLNSCHGEFIILSRGFIPFPLSTSLSAKLKSPYLRKDVDNVNHLSFINIFHL